MADMPPIVRHRAQDAAPLHVLRALHAGEYSAVVIEEVLSPEQCEGVTGTIKDSGLQRTVMPEFLVAGGLLMFSEGAKQYAENNRALLALIDEYGLVESVLEQFAKRCEKAGIFQFPTGEHAAPFSIRELLPGGEIAIHSERDDWPGMDSIRDQLDLSTQLSYYVQLQSADNGGVLTRV